MTTLKKLTSGLQNTSDMRCNIFDTLFVFITILQGDNESDASCMKRLKLNLDSLLLSGGKKMLCVPKLLETVNPGGMVDDEIEVEENNLR